jgi:hypothetical protein
LNRRLPTSTEIEVIEQPTNADESIKSTDRGIIIDLTEQYAKHDSSIRVNLESLSNVMLSILEYLKLPSCPPNPPFECSKHDLLRTSTDRGIIIDLTEQYVKHDSSIRVNLESLSKVMLLVSQCSKHDLQRTSTDRGIIIDLTEQCAKHDSSIRVNLESLSNIMLSIL